MRSGEHVAPPVGRVRDITRVQLSRRAREVAALIGLDRDDLANLAEQASANPAEQDVLVAKIRTVADPRQQLADGQTRADHAELFGSSGRSIFNHIRRGMMGFIDKSTHAATGNPLIPWLGRLRNHPKAVIATILNFFAYNELKIRAGVIGANGVAKLVDGWNVGGRQIHLVGHSFGARVMTSAANSCASPIASLTMLEGAYSQNGISEDVIDGISGAFRDVTVKHKVAGPTVSVGSHHDTAVWIAYPLASRVFKDPAAVLGAVFGGPDDVYGAMGANGPQNLVDVQVGSFDGASVPDLRPGTVHTFNCTSFIANHGDVWKNGTARLIAASI